MDNHLECGSQTHPLSQVVLTVPSDWSISFAPGETGLGLIRFP